MPFVLFLVVWWTAHCTGVSPCLDQLVEVPQLCTLHHWGT